MRMGLYARVSTQDQQTLALQRDAMAVYVQQRGWSIVLTIEETSSGASEHRHREVLMQAAQRTHRSEAEPAGPATANVLASCPVRSTYIGNCCAAS